MQILTFYIAIATEICKKTKAWCFYCAIPLLNASAESLLPSKNNEVLLKVDNTGILLLILYDDIL